jgi:hypothetical protein
MTAMQDVEHAIGQHHGLRQAGDTLCQLGADAHLFFEVRHRPIIPAEKEKAAIYIAASKSIHAYLGIKPD